MAKTRKPDPNGYSKTVRERGGGERTYFCTYTAEEYEQRFGSGVKKWQSK